MKVIGSTCARINEPDKAGGTALGYAAVASDKPTVEFLKEKGARFELDGMNLMVWRMSIPQEVLDYLKTKSKANFAGTKITSALKKYTPGDK